MAGLFQIRVKRIKTMGQRYFFRKKIENPKVRFKHLVTRTSYVLNLAPSLQLPGHSCYVSVPIITNNRYIVSLHCVIKIIALTESHGKCLLRIYNLFIGSCQMMMEKSIVHPLQKD